MIRIPFVAALCMLPPIWAACNSARAIEPKPYTIGIAPSHITKPTAPLFSDRMEERNSL